jgi:hypothetical protein
VATTRLLIFAAAVLAVVAVVAALRRSAGAPALLADPVRTPGMLNPDVTQATIAQTICVQGWTRTVRPPTDYTNALKSRQMRVYHETGPPSGYQEDHLISLELGGHPTDPRNLWPEPYPRAAKVDTIENELNARVCSGSLTLAQAQEQESALKHTHG